MILDMIQEWFKELLIDGIISNLTGMFDTLNTKVGEIAGEVGMTPAAWNSSIFNMIRNLSETVIVPIAGIILTFIMCYELIQLIIEKNNLQKYDQMVMKEMKSQGKSFGTEANPRQQGEQTSQKTSSSKPAENEKYSYPLKRNEFMLVTSPFGMRKDPLNPANTQMHKGIDIQAKHDNVLATEDKGKVTQVNNNPNTAGGLSVTVEYNRNDGSKYQCTYMHLSSIAVKTGDTVNAGQRLGVTGNTGT